MMYVCDNCEQEYEADITADELVTACQAEIEDDTEAIYLLCSDCFKLMSGEESIH